MKLTFRNHCIYIRLVRFVSTRQTRWYLVLPTYIIAVLLKMKKVIRGEIFRSKTVFLSSVTSGG